MNIKKTFSEYMIFFTVYCVIGWLYEAFLQIFVDGYWADRSFLYGPFCPIYGFGMVIILAVFGRVAQKKFEGKFGFLKKVMILFFGIMLLATITELIGSYAMEAATGSFMWDYTRFSFNFQGRIAPFPSFRFGVVGTTCILTIQQLVYKFMPEKNLNKIGLGLFIFFVANLVLTLMK